MQKSVLCIIKDSLDLWWQILFAFNMLLHGCGDIPRMNADSQVPGGLLCKAPEAGGCSSL